MKTKDLTIGNPWKVLLFFALPMIISVTLQQIYNIADSSIAGRMISSDALAAVSASYPVTMIYLSVATGLGVGSSVVISKFFGSKNYLKTRETIYTALIFAAGLALFMSVLGFFITDLSLKILEIPDNIFKDTSTYLKFYCCGLFFTYLYNVITCIFQSLGNSKTPLYFLIISTLINIGLDILFVKGFSLGVMGLALGTLIAQGIAMTLSFVFLMITVRKFLPDEEKASLFSFDLLKQILGIAIPSIIQGCTISVGNLFIQRYINTFGSDLIAGYGAAYKLSYIVIYIFTAYSNAIATYTSQNIGAWNKERITEGYRYSLIICVIFGIVSSVILLSMPTILLKIFMKQGSSPDAMNYGKWFIYITSPFLLLMAFKIPADGVLKGSKDMLSFMISTFADLIIRIVFSYVLGEKIGFKGIFIAWPLGWLIGALLSFSAYLIGRWKKIAFGKEEKEN